jgi:hypothetical protein
VAGIAGGALILTVIVASVICVLARAKDRTLSEVSAESIDEGRQALIDSTGTNMGSTTSIPGSLVGLAQFNADWREYRVNRAAFFTESDEDGLFQ